MEEIMEDSEYPGAVDDIYEEYLQAVEEDVVVFPIDDKTGLNQVRKMLNKGEIKRATIALSNEDDLQQRFAYVCSEQELNDLFPPLERVAIIIRRET